MRKDRRLGYQDAEIAAALRQPAAYRRAVQELAVLLPAPLPKAARQRAFEDALLAVQLCDGDSRNRQAVSAMVRVAERCMPKAKALQLGCENRKRQVALHRGSAAAEAVDPEAPELFLPPGVLDLLLDKLDPLTLATAACVCRQWRGAADASGAWLRALSCGAGEGSVPPPPCVGRLAFRDLIREHPEVLLRWRSPRAAIGRRLLWLQPDHPTQVLPGFQEPRLTFRATEWWEGCRPPPRFPSLKEVGQMVGGLSETDSSSSSDSEAGATGAASWSRPRRRLWLSPGSD